jgi:hypothetical protein
MLIQNSDGAAGLSGRLCDENVVAAGGNDDTAIVGLDKQVLGGSILPP